jgi:hypothetical protein
MFTRFVLHSSFPVWALALAASSVGCSSHDSATSADAGGDASGADAGPPAVCAAQNQGMTADGDPVVVCTRTFTTPPFVRPPADGAVTSGATSLYGTVVFASGDPANETYQFEDRSGKMYDLTDAAGTPLSSTSAILTQNHLPSSRVHFLVYQAIGVVSDSQLKVTSLRPAILVDGRAMDARFLGAWEGTMNLRVSDQEWSDTQTANVRVELTALEATDAIPGPDGAPLTDGARFKATGTVTNASATARLSTGACAASLASLGASNPLSAATSSAIDVWRVPAMHTIASTDFHVVLDYPPGLYPNAIAMAQNHNFRLSDYLSTATEPMTLTFQIHANPVGQLLVVLTPVSGGGGPC